MNTIVPTAFEEKRKIHYFTDEERREKGLSPEHMLIGTGICPICSQKINVASDRGMAGLGASRNFSYFENHYPNDELYPKLCHGSEQVFILLEKEGLATT